MDHYAAVTTRNTGGEHMEWWKSGFLVILFLCMVGVNSADAQSPDRELAQAELTEKERLSDLADSRMRLSTALKNIEEKYDISFMYKTGLLFRDSNIPAEASVPSEALEQDNLA